MVPTTICLRFDVFKFKASGATDSARVLRWIQKRFVEFGGSLTAWSQAYDWHISIVAQRRVCELIACTVKNGYLASPFGTTKLRVFRSWFRKLKTVASQARRVLALVSVERPPCSSCGCPHR